LLGTPIRKFSELFATTFTTYGSEGANLSPTGLGSKTSALPSRQAAAAKREIEMTDLTKIAGTQKQRASLGVAELIATAAEVTSSPEELADSANRLRPKLRPLDRFIDTVSWPMNGKWN
jgi:hypothetical protein